MHAVVWLIIGIGIGQLLTMVSLEIGKRIGRRE
jgi:hypothetical protein